MFRLCWAFFADTKEQICKADSVLLAIIEGLCKFCNTLYNFRESRAVNQVSLYQIRVTIGSCPIPNAFRFGAHPRASGGLGFSVSLGPPSIAAGHASGRVIATWWLMSLLERCWLFKGLKQTVNAIPKPYVDISPVYNKDSDYPENPIKFL